MDVSDTPLLNVIITFHILSAVSWLTIQTLSLLTDAKFASWSMPDILPCSDDADVLVVNDYPLGTQIVAVTFADFIVLLTLTITSAAGLINRELYGLVCSWMVFAINIHRTMTIFWQAVMSGQFIATEATPIIERCIVYFSLIFSIWGSWFQCRYFRRPEKRGGYS